MATTKKRDDEFSSILIACGVFSLVLVIADILWAKWGQMPVWVLALVIICHGLTALGWYKIIRNWTNPNFDWWRKFVVATAVLGIITILGHRNDWIGKQQFKTEQR